jgi:predicted kinase
LYIFVRADALKSNFGFRENGSDSSRVSGSWSAVHEVIQRRNTKGMSRRMSTIIAATRFRGRASGKP